LNWLVGTLPVMAKNAELSSIAAASAITRLAEPGPQEVKVATGSWRTLK
jgi:hypothetical protein